MSRFMPLVRCLQSAKCGRLVEKQRLYRLPVSVTAGAPYKVLSRFASKTAESEHDSASLKHRNFLFETMGSARQRQEQDKASLVIFDKDGTLICFHSMWSSWAVKITENIAKAVDMDIEDKLYEALGVCAKTKRIFPGLLAEMTTPIIKEELIKLLVAEGVKEELAKKAVTDSWMEGDTGQGVNVVRSIHPDLRTLFRILKANDIKIAICTADNRRGTLNTLRNLELMSYVDMVVCGDDANTQPKPSPHNAWKICGELGVDPQEAVMVGDTKADVGMGHSAKLGWVVGVLSGVGDTEELLPEAHYIIDNVKDLLPLILPYEDWVNCYTYTSFERVLREPHDLQPEKSMNIERINMDNFDVVIFDLQGTLVCTHNKYMNWLEKLIASLESKTGMALGPLVYKHLGVCEDSKQVQCGVLAEGGTPELKEALVKLLMKLGFHYEESIITINQVWKEGEEEMKNAKIVSLDRDTELLFRTLKENGVKIGINTSNARENAVRDIQACGLTPYVDIMVCGDDPMSQMKPRPHNVHLICQEMGTTPERAAVIGDSMEDVSMGLNARTGLTIGVLTGVGTHSELVQADHIVDRVSDILSHLKSDDDGDNSNGGYSVSSKSAAASGLKAGGKK